MPQGATKIWDGSPRYHHKTTQIVQEAADTGHRNLVIAPNHTLAETICYEHLGNGQYGIGQRRVVHLQGIERSCPGCNHDPGENWYKHDSAAEEALEQHRVVTPQVFDDPEICPYYATKYAAEKADWVVTVPEMIDRLEIDYEDYNIIIDEESTLAKFYPQSGTVMKFEEIGEDFIPINVTTTENKLSETAGLQRMEQIVQNKIDDLQRVPTKYRNALSGIQALQDVGDQILEQVDFSEVEDLDEANDILRNVEIDSPDLDGPNSQVTGTFTYLRRNFSRYEHEPLVEAMYFDPKLIPMRSGDELKVFLVPDPFAGIVFHKEAFETCANLYLVGRDGALHFCNQLGLEDREIIEMGLVQTTNLDIVVARGDEMKRRGFMTRLSQRLAEDGFHNLIICGSGTRAANASLGPSSYLFQGDATLEHYQVARDADWSVSSYMGSRITRGVDIDTQITIVRSAQFASPKWHYWDEYDEEDDWEITYHHISGRRREYENLIEVHNAMLRGAGQGEQHVAVIPEIPLFFGLERYVTHFDLDEFESVVEFILQALGEIPDELYCETCERRFVTINGFRNHDCGGHAPPI